MECVSLSQPLCRKGWLWSLSGDLKRTQVTLSLHRAQKGLLKHTGSSLFAFGDFTRGGCCAFWRQLHSEPNLDNGIEGKCIVRRMPGVKWHETLCPLWFTLLCHGLSQASPATMVASLYPWPSDPGCFSGLFWFIFPTPDPGSPAGLSSGAEPNSPPSTPEAFPPSQRCACCSYYLERSFAPCRTSHTPQLHWPLPSFLPFCLEKEMLLCPRNLLIFFTYTNANKSEIVE